MKTPTLGHREFQAVIFFAPVLTLSGLQAVAQLGLATTSPPPHFVASRAAHETVWQRVEEPSRFGLSRERVSAYVELATGLNFFDETTQAWRPSREEWEVYPEAIVARWGQHQVVLATNLNLPGAVEVLTPDGVRLVSRPVSLGLYDPVDGKQMVIAELKDCVPVRGASANEIVFRDCFDRLRGSIRYLYTRAGVHQHVVLEQRLELPEGFSDQNRLECYTVFAADTPQPRITTRVLRGERDARLRALMVEPDFTDSEISFGESMAMRAGRAFSLGDEAQARSIRVGKQFSEIDGLPVLIEAVEFEQIEPLLARLAALERSGTGGLAIIQRGGSSGQRSRPGCRVSVFAQGSRRR
ncbi:MAG: hypothetical protein KJ070_26310 [Verrucomicrobia bacterium]|nr:hypothetical protein [Verrucomicrobiota bacterium]